MAITTTRSQPLLPNDFIFRSPFPPPSIPSNLTVPEFLLHPLHDHLHSIALVDGSDGREFSYSQVQSLSANVAAGLSLLCRLSKGDVVLVVLPNSPEYCVLVLGIMSAGGVFTGANPLSHPRELQRQLVESQAKVVIADSASYIKVAPFVDEQIPIVIVGKEKPPGTISVEELFEVDGSIAPPVAVSQQDLCAMPFSSGTTGLSKGVMVTHRNLIANICFVLFDEEQSAVPGRNVTLGVLPFFHIYGFANGFCATMRAKGKVVVLARFDLRQFLSASLKYGVTFSPVVPPIMLALVKSPVVNDFDLGKLKLQSVMTAAAPLAPGLRKAFEAKFGVMVEEAYGLTEHGFVTRSHCAPGHTRGIAKKGSIGFLLPGLEAKFLDPETGKSVPVSTLGELCIRSECVTPGYLRNPEATSSTIDEQGWLHTGDACYIDEDGDIFFVERIKELIKYKGFQVPPAELEAILTSHPQIEDAAVVPIPDEEAGEIPVACIAPTSGSSLTEEDVIQFVASQVSYYKKIRLVRFIAAVPKTASGKILRAVVKESLLKSLQNGHVTECRT